MVVQLEKYSILFYSILFWKCFYCVLCFNPFLSGSGKLLSLTKALSETLVDLLNFVFQERPWQHLQRIGNIWVRVIEVSWVFLLCIFSETCKWFWKSENPKTKREPEIMQFLISPSRSHINSFVKIFTEHLSYYVPVSLCDSTAANWELSKVSLFTALQRTYKAAHLISSNYENGLLIWSLNLFLHNSPSLVPSLHSGTIQVHIFSLQSPHPLFSRLWKLEVFQTCLTCCCCGFQTLYGFSNIIWLVYW